MKLMTESEPKWFWKKSNFSAIFYPHDSYETDPCKNILVAASSPHVKTWTAKSTIAHRSIV